MRPEGWKEVDFRLDDVRVAMTLLEQASSSLDVERVRLEASGLLERVKALLGLPHHADE